MFVDALRGVAALAVVVDHLAESSALAPVLYRIVPRTLIGLFLFGSHGVQIFFVISGFVIAHSLRSMTIGWRTFAHFIARRQLRLDPPYWLMIIISWLIWAAKRPFPVFHVDPIPRLGAILANCFYLQRILRLPEIIGVAWTLCIEVQFYIAFILLLMLARGARGRNSSPGSGLPALVIATTGSLAIFTNPNITYQAVWCVHAWPYFAGGVLAYWFYQSRIGVLILGTFLAIFGCSMCYFGIQSSTIVGLCTIFALAVVGRLAMLETLGRNRVLQYFGLISYSLYLVHREVIYIVMRAGSVLTGENGAMAVAWMFLSLVTSIIAADRFYHIIEKRSKRWSSRLQLRPTQVPIEQAAGDPLAGVLVGSSVTSE